MEWLSAGAFCLKTPDACHQTKSQQQQSCQAFSQNRYTFSFHY